EQRLLGLRGNPVSRFTCRRIDACSTGAEHEPAGDDRLAVRTERRWGLVGRYCTACRLAIHERPDCHPVRAAPSSAPRPPPRLVPPATRTRVADAVADRVRTTTR